MDNIVNTLESALASVISQMGYALNYSSSNGVDYPATGEPIAVIEPPVLISKEGCVRGRKVERLQVTLSTLIGSSTPEEVHALYEGLSQDGQAALLALYDEVQLVELSIQACQYQQHRGRIEVVVSADVVTNY